MNTTEGERNRRIARIMWDHNVTHSEAARVADAEIRFEERKAAVQVAVLEGARKKAAK